MQMKYQKDFDVRIHGKAMEIVKGRKMSRALGQQLISASRNQLKWKRGKQWVTECEYKEVPINRPNSMDKREMS
jgi:hypothetical protein